MYEYIYGEITEISPSFAIIEAAQIGYFIKISLNTYEKINTEKNIKLFIHQILREDTNELFGFAEKSEREIFRHLISVSGIGANTARLMLSSLSPDEIISAIVNGDVQRIKSVKGIGLKTAQRIIVDLKDKVDKMGYPETMAIAGSTSAINIEEATSALVMLGFNKKQVEKTLQKIAKQKPSASVEDLVKAGIQSLSKA